MNAISILAEAEGTVTISRQDFEAILDRLEDASDLAAVEKHRVYEARVGWEAAKDSYFSLEETMAILDGASPVKVLRDRRGMKQADLAAKAGVSASYLAEIEGGKKPGSFDALRKLASALAVPMENLAPVEVAA